MDKKSIGHKILYSPVTRILTGLIICAGIVVAAQLTLEQLFKSTAIDKDFRNLIGGIIMSVLVLTGYSLLFRVYEKRKIRELWGTGIVRNITTGILLGSILLSLTIFVMYLFNGFTVISVNPFLFIVPSLTMAITSAIIEETLFRGIVFRITEEKLGSYPALLISALIFGAMHLANPNSSLTMALGLAVQAGLLLGAAYIYSGSLWLPIAIHFGWNFTQGGIFGANVSGNTISKSLLDSRIEGAHWLTGGEFGPEGSVQATVFCLVATIILLILSHKQNKITGPFRTK